MGYSLSPDLLRERIGSVDLGPGLQALIAGKSAAWNVPQGSTNIYAFKLRECLYIAEHFPEYFPELAKAAAQYRIVVIGDNRRTANRIEAQPRRGASDTVTSSAHDFHPTQGIGDLRARDVATVGLVTAMSIVDAWRKHLPSNDPIQFTQTTLPLDELLALYRWARTQTPRLMFFVIDDGGLTLSVAQEDAEPYAWHPQERKPEETFDL